LFDEAQGGGGGGGVSQQQLFNPPFVQALQYVCEGRAIACVAGSGEIKLLKSSNSAILNSIEAHNGMATSMHVCAGGGRVVLSGGVDGQVRAWQLQEKQEEVKKASAGGGGKAGGGGGAVSGGYSVDISPLWTIDHGRKINALTSSNSGDADVIAGPLIVGDVSKDITIYMRPS